MTILPQVRSMTYRDGTFIIPPVLSVKTDKHAINAYRELQTLIPCVKAGAIFHLIFEIDPFLASQSYRLSIDKDKIIRSL